MRKKLYPESFLLIYLGYLTFFCACRNITQNSLTTKADSIKAMQEWNNSVQGGFSAQQTLSFDSVHIEAFLTGHPEFGEFDSTIRHFYMERGYTYAWFDGDGLLEQAGNLIDRVSNIKEDGIFTPLAYKKELDSLVSEYNQKASSKPLLALELMLTGQYFSFAHKVWGGMDASVSEKASWFLPRKSLSYERYLDSLVNDSSSSTKIGDVPVYRQYNLLKQHLSKFMRLQEHPWPALALSGDALKPGDTSAIILDIRSRLFLLGDYDDEPSAAHTIYGEDLEQAVRRYQMRTGLSPDGVLGKRTLKELNKTPKERATTILVNMERSRWLPLSLKDDYLAVNIPEFKLHVYHADSLLWSTNVVVGKDVHKTVIFSGEIQYIVFSPYWNIPGSIVRNEILPHMRRDRNYLSKKNMEITGYSNGIPIIRQKPGPSNSLGRVKFLFPNSHNIYLHDTPAKPLFNESSRAFSHGCVRVQNPEKLAEFLLRRDTTWKKETIYNAMHRDKEKWVPLTHKVPVFLTYFTAFVDRSGIINFRGDIYDRDDRLAEMIIK